VSFGNLEQQLRLGTFGQSRHSARQALIGHMCDRPEASRKQCFFFGFAFTLSTKSSLVHPGNRLGTSWHHFRKSLLFGVLLNLAWSRKTNLIMSANKQENAL
jgi:hypothetical protein